MRKWFQIPIIIAFSVTILIEFDLNAQTTLSYPHFPYKKWVLIGLPITPSNPSPDNLFAVFGVAGQQWRLSRWNINYDLYMRYGEPEGGTDLGNPPGFSPGLGYWFYQNSRADTTLSVQGTLAPTNATYYIPLDPPANNHRGLNMVANPFNAPIDWKNTLVKVKDGSTETEVSLSDANNLYLLDNYAYRWDVDQQVYVPYSAQLGGVLDVWDGFWVEQLSSMAAELVVYRVNKLQGGSSASARFYNATVGGKLDYLGTNNARETDRLDLTVSNTGSNVWITTSAKSVVTNQFPLTEGYTLIDNNKIEIRLVEVIAGTYLTYRFQVSTTNDFNYKQGMKYIAFDFKQGQIVAPFVPNSGYNLVTTIRTPLESKKALLSLELGIPPNQSLPKSMPVKPTYVQPVSERDWFMSLRIEDATGTYKDLYNGIGIRSDASDGYESYDAKNFAPMKANNDFVDLYFPHNDTADIVNYWWERPDIFCYDVRGDSNTKVWNMTIAAYNIPNRTLTLSWDASQVNADWALELYDVSSQQKIDMLTNSGYTFTTPNQQYTKLPFTIEATFQPLVSIKTLSNQPENFQLFKAYPNPFNATTNLTYGLTQAGAATITIYNMLGQIITQVNLYHAQRGIYQIQWNGSDQNGNPLPSGIYFARLKTADDQKMQKLILIK
jgi:hypothetical protein